jgi:hypothetical protein
VLHMGKAYDLAADMHRLWCPATPASAPALSGRVRSRPGLARLEAVHYPWKGQLPGAIYARNRIGGLLLLPRASAPATVTLRSGVFLAQVTGDSARRALATASRSTGPGHRPGGSLR